MPAGLEAFGVPSTVRSGANACWTASAAVVDSSADGTLACSYGLAPAAAMARNLHIGRMLFKPTGSGAQAAAATAAAAKAAAEAAQLMYAVQWEASSSAGSHSMAPAATQQGLQWQLGSGTQLRLPAAHGAGSLHALQSSLSVLQATISNRARPTVALSTLLPAAGQRSSPALAAAAGLLGVVARESTAQHFALFSSDTLAAQVPQVPAESADSYGVRVQGACAWLGGVWEAKLPLRCDLASVALPPAFACDNSLP